jgi:glycosyltransferase involved in cell wall biosynthesis
MKVLYDHQTFTLQEYGGISRYFFELYNRFEEIGGHTCETSLLLSNNAYLNSVNAKNIKGFFPGKVFPGKARFQEAINRFQSISKIKAGNFDVFHPTYYNPYFLKHLKGKPFVVTFLDMIHEKFNNLYPELEQDKKIFANKKQLLDNASKVIAISECTKKDIMEIFGVSGSNIEVIYLGSSMGDITKKANSVLIVEGRYLLFVGNRGMYKNFDFYLESIADILKTEDIKMVCAGGGNFNEKEIEHISKLGLKNLVKFYSINDQVLQSLYANSIAFVFPSLYEGFGIPVLEAFSCKTPCLLSRGGSLEEVGGNAALYFNGNDSEEIRSKLKLLLTDKSIAKDLVAKGIERLKQFSWGKTFQETLDVYKSVI